MQQLLTAPGQKLFTVSREKVLILEQGGKQIKQIIKSSRLSAEDKKLFEKWADPFSEDRHIIKFKEALISWDRLDQIPAEDKLIVMIEAETASKFLQAALYLVVAKLGKLEKTSQFMATLEKVSSKGFMQITGTESSLVSRLLRKQPQVTFTQLPFLSREGTTVLLGSIEKCIPERAKQQPVQIVHRHFEVPVLS